MRYQYTSNNIRLLAGQLFNDLYQPGDTPLTTRCVVTSSPQAAQWLKDNYLKKSQTPVLLGIQFTPISSFLSHFFQSLQLQKQTHQLTPTIESLYLAIYSIVSNASSTLIPNELGKLIERYLPTTKPNTTNKKIISFCEHTAELFNNYLQLGVDICALSNIQVKHPESLTWQQQLWQLLFKGNQSPFINFFNLNPIENKYQLDFPSLHFFDIDQLPLYMEKLLLHSGQSIKTYFYQFSPSFQFWNDLLTDKQRYFLLKKESQKKNLHVDHDLETAHSHRLLRNLGKLGRKLNKTYESLELEPEELYTINASILDQQPYQQLLRPDIFHIQSSKKLTLLETLQHDILFAHLDREEKALQELDGSLAILKAELPFEEVEAAHQKIFDLLNKRSLSPDDVTIYVTDSTSYLPLIERIFGATYDILPYSSLNSNQNIESPLVEGLEILFNAIGSRWKKSTINALLKNTAIQSTFSISSKDIKILESLIEDQEPFCLSPTHLNIYLDREGLNQAQSFHQHHTWLSLLKFWCRSATVDSNLPTYAANQSVDLTQLSSLNKLYSLLATLDATVCQILSTKGATLTEWIHYIETIIETLFNTADDVNKDEEYIMLIKRMNYLRAMYKVAPQQPFSFEAIYPILKSLLHTPLKSQPLYDRQSVKVIPLSKGIILPSKLSCILGLDEGRFPRLSTKEPLNLAKHSSFEKHLPTSIEEDDYHFLKVLMLTEESLILSYSSRCNQTKQPLQPSSALSQLIKTINEEYTFCSESQANCLIQSAKGRAYKNRSLHPQLNFNPSSEPQKAPPTINLSQLQKQLINPLYSYIKRHHQVSIYPKQPSVESPLKLPLFTKSLVNNSAGPYSTDQLVDFLEHQGTIPEGFSKKAHHQRIEKTHQKAQQMWSELAPIHPLYIIESPEKPHPEETKKHTQIKQPEGLTINGLLGNICEQGLVLPLKKKEDLLKYWASIVAYGQVSNQLNLPPHIISLFTGQKLDVTSFASKQVWKDLFILNDLMGNNPSPLCFSVYQQLLEGESLSQAIELTLQEDPVFKKWHTVYNLNSISNQILSRTFELISNTLVQPFEQVKEVGFSHV